MAVALELVSVDSIRDAAARLRGVALRTPLLPFGPPEPNDPFGRTRAYLKPENLQPMGAFKIRGAYNAIASLPAAVRARGVVSHSSGNHARGVARAARLLGVRAVIVMPAGASEVKVAGVREDGAEIRFVGPSSEERAAVAAEMSAREGLALIPSYDDAAIIAGQGTVGLEIVEQIAELAALGEPDGRRADASADEEPVTVLAPIGGGGLASGIAVAVKSLRPGARLFGVEPELAADARDSLREGRVVRWAPEDVARTSADGMRTTSVGTLPFAHLARYLDGVLVVSEREIAAAMARAARDARLVVEPSGATTVAAWLFHAAELPAEGRVVCVVSGGNVDPERYAQLVAEGTAVEDGGERSRS